MNLRIFDTADDLVRSAARTLRQRIASGARSIALSGGSTPKPLYELLGEDPPAEPITWVVVDERYVPIDDPQSNAGMIESTLFAKGKPEGHRFLRFRTELGDPVRTAAEFEREWKSIGLVHLDIVLLGMGDDGHTASLFPGFPAVEERARRAVATSSSSATSCATSFRESASIWISSLRALAMGVAVSMARSSGLE